MSPKWNVLSLYFFKDIHLVSVKKSTLSFLDGDLAKVQVSVHMLFKEIKIVQTKNLLFLFWTAMSPKCNFLCVFHEESSNLQCMQAISSQKVNFPRLHSGAFSFCFSFYLQVRERRSYSLESLTIANAWQFLPRNVLIFSQKQQLFFSIFTTCWQEWYR